MSGIYTIPFSAATVSVAQDLFIISAHASKQCVLLGFEIAVAGIAADAGDAQEELLALRIRSGLGSVGSGGAAAVIANVDSAGGASGFTARVNDTTKASGGTPVIHWQGAMNSRVGIDKPFTESQQLIFGASRILVIELVDAPTDPLALTGTAWVQEIG